MIAFADRAYRFLSSEVRGLHAAAYVLATSAILSSILALVRDRLLAHTFGASSTLDIYYAAFRIPDLIFVAAGALVSVYILIPELSRRSAEGERDYIDTIVAGFSLFAVAVAALAFVAAPALLARFFPAFVADGSLPHVVLLTRIMLLQPILLGLSNICAAITQTRGRYGLYAFSPLLYNVGIIAGITLFYPVLGLAGLAWGVVAGAALHLGIQVPSAMRDGFFRRVPKMREAGALLTTALISLPRALALSMSQMTIFGLTAIAGLLPAGSIAIFILAHNLNNVPLSVIGASYSVAAFPTLASAFSRGERSEFISLVAIATRYVFFWSVPASVLILVLRAHIVRVALGSGAFDWTDTRLTAAVFALFALSLAAQGLLLLLFRAYYAAGRTYVPLAVATLTAALTLLIAWFSVAVFDVPFLGEAVESFLRVDGLLGSAVVGLGMAYSIATLVGALVLIMHFETVFSGYFALIWRGIGESCIAALIGGLSAYNILEFVSALSVASTSLTIFTHGAIAGVFGILMASLAYYVLGSREFDEVAAAVHARLWRRGAEVVSSAEQQI